MIKNVLENFDQSEEPLPVDTIAERWGDAVASGFTAVPNSLIRAQVGLGLTPNDIVVVLNILVHWWSSDRLPFPRTSVIAKRTGLSQRTVQRSLKTLRKKGLVVRIRGANQPSRFDLDGLITALSWHAINDPWNRPNKVRAPGELPRTEAGEGLQNPSPRQP